jgi:hypothetical protein
MELRDEDFENINPGEPRPLIEEGLWPAQWLGREARVYGWGEKLIFEWKVFMAFDKTRSVSLSRFYNAERDKAKRFVFGPLHDYRKDWVAANGGRLPLDRSRLPLSIWRDRLFLVEVVTVRQDSKGRPLSASFLWSRIGRVLRPLMDGEHWERLPVQPLNSAD